MDLMFRHGMTPTQRLMWLKKLAGGGSSVLKTVTGTLLHILDALAKPAVSFEVGIEPQQSGSGDPSPENVRPITGWTGVDITRAGKNIIDIPNLSGISVSNNQMAQIPNGFRLTKTQNSSSYSPRIFYLPDWVAGKTITFSTDITITGTQNGGIRAIAYSGVYTQKVNYGEVAGTSGRISKTITFPDSLPSDADGFAINFYCAFSTPANVGDYTDYTNVMAELSSTATEYEVYQSTTIPITFPDAAGTVYGGTLTNNGTGEWGLSVDRVNVDLGSISWYAHASLANVFTGDGYRLPKWVISDGGIASAICSAYVLTTSASGGVDRIDCSIALGTGGSTNIYVHDSTVSDLTEFRTAISGIQLVYELATPVTYTLTEQQALVLLKGENNIWSSITNGTLSLTYKAQA